jgi:hypothetical protein
MDAQLYNRFSIFRFNTLLMLAFSLAVVHLTAAESEQKKVPEAVYVAVEQARLYAGPSSDFYPTGDAKRGTVLEVYHRTQNGWLGVRPPQGSFSWVPASQAYLLPGGRVIEIIDANSVSWIGTELGSAKQYRWQVQLKVGEQLTVLGEATIKNDTDDQEALWYKVSPPAGEFRWIEQTVVSKTAPPVAPTAIPSDSQVGSKAVEAQSAEPKSKPKESSLAEAKKVDVNKSVAEKAVVQTASFDRPTAPTRGPGRLSANSKRVSANSKKTNASWKLTPPENEWDGWHAFEMNEEGVRTPFLDKLSGRDRGRSGRLPQAPVAENDPLLQDPFSLTMVGEPQKPLPGELNAVTSKQREWRDPRSLREARLAGSSQGSPASMAARRDSNLPPNSPSVLLASSDNLQNVGNNLAVNTAGYDRNTTPPMETAQADARENVDWYGLAEAALTPRSAPSFAPGTALNVVTRAADVGDLQLALNNAVASSNGPWNLAPLAERARYLIEHGPTAIDRGQARLLLERIEAFQNVSARAQQITGPTPFQISSVQSTSFNAATQNLSLPNSPQAGVSTYDATGWLVPVHAAGPDQPTHALTNDTGDVVAYVSPIAGLNLDRYRNQAVGINGLRGYLPQLQAAHIQAQRVSQVR